MKYWDRLREVTKAIPHADIHPLTSPSNFQGGLAVLTTWAMIAGSFVLVALWPNLLTVLIALCIIGGRQLALAILMHEASHKILFRSRVLNETIGQWVCAYPTWNDLIRYRDHHLKHHLETGSDTDPDMGLVTPYPTTKMSFLRKTIRDLTGVTAIKRVYGIWLMDTGKIAYTISTGVVPIDQTNRSLSDKLRFSISKLKGVVITNLILFSILWFAGHPMLYLLWVGAYMTTFSFFLRVRSIAEHSCVTDPENPLTNTRTIQAGFLERITVAPHFVNYHLEHHLYMAVPFFNLPKVHKILKKEGILERASTAKNYREVIRLASSKSS